MTFFVILLQTIETKIKMQELKFHGRETEHQKLEQQPFVENFAEVFAVLSASLHMGNELCPS